LELTTTAVFGLLTAFAAGLLTVVFIALLPPQAENSSVNETMLEIEKVLTLTDFLRFIVLFYRFFRRLSG
jgi:hypothetical protein